MSPPNKVARLWEGVGVGVLVEVARDEWKQERRVALMWLRWPKHLNPFLSLFNPPLWLWAASEMLWQRRVLHWGRGGWARLTRRELHAGAHPSHAVPSSWFLVLLPCGDSRWEHLCLHMGSADLLEWWNQCPKGKQGAQWEEPSPVLHTSGRPLARGCPSSAGKGCKCSLLLL